jgi:2-C-methyl-D-erythritol 4-phosphate cytidylyltransferase/2-C-methyl-D-erythritol 2,4-cyclodiphosphate synthase
MQTPQACGATPCSPPTRRAAALAEITDDVQLLELAGREVWLVEGEERNLKITTAADLQLAVLLLVPESPSASG